MFIKIFEFIHHLDFKLIYFSPFYQFLLKIDSDEHIFKFVLAKMGYGEAMKR